VETTEKAHEDKRDVVADEECGPSEEKQAPTIRVRTEIRAGVGGAAGNGIWYP